MTVAAVVKYYTYKKNVPLVAGQHVQYTKGKGYYAYPPIAPPAPGVVQLPVGPFVKRTSEAYFGSQAGSVINGLDIENLKGNNDGLLVMAWPPKLSTSRYKITNIITQAIGNTPPTSDGTSEAGIWVGASADVDRVVADGTWEGLWTGAECADSIFTNVTVGRSDGKGGYTLASSASSAGVYLEHFTRRSVFNGGRVYAPNARYGFILEWWYPDSYESPFVSKEYPTAKAGEAGSCHNTIENYYVWCPKGGYGIYLDQGSWGNTTRNIVFDGPGGAYHEVGPLAGPDANVFDVPSCTFLNGGSRGESHLTSSVGDPSRKSPVKIAWRDVAAARAAA